MNLDHLYRPSFTSDELVEELYLDPGLDLANIEVNDDSDRVFHHAVSELYLEDYPTPFKFLQSMEDPTEVHKKLQTKWAIPIEYKKLDIVAYILSTSQSQTEYARLIEELEQYDARDMLPLLCYMKYLVDTMRKHKLVWGVGRGSSVASYVLYKIGIHRIDSLKYNLDWHEFLR
jgi:DNA polymerase-3 subunit alpha